MAYEGGERGDAALRLEVIQESNERVEQAQYHGHDAPARRGC